MLCWTRQTYSRVLSWNQCCGSCITYSSINFCDKRLHSFQHVTIQNRFILPNSILYPNIALSNSLNIVSNAPVNQTTRGLRFTSRRLEETDDDLKAILKDKSLSLTAKFKIIFRQYGLVMIAVHLMTSAVWVCIFYQAVKR